MTAEEWNELGREALDGDHLERAVKCFKEAVLCEPEWSVAHYNLGLAYKFLGRWRDCKESNLRAHELNPEDDATYWNLAIASVADDDWEAAARAFVAIGLPSPEGEPPWDFKLGLVPIRVNPDESPEVVWCHRLDPVRAQIANIPFPDCGRRYGDVILNDGAPNGYRELNGKEVPVFDELRLLRESGLGTYQLDVYAPEPEGLEQLFTLFEEYEVPAENWTTSVRFLCKACSEGRPHTHHDEERADVDSGEFQLGLAAKGEGDIRRVLERWRGGEIRGLSRAL